MANRDRSNRRRRRQGKTGRKITAIDCLVSLSIVRPPWVVEAEHFVGFFAPVGAGGEAPSESNGMRIMPATNPPMCAQNATGSSRDVRHQAHHAGGNLQHEPDAQQQQRRQIDDRDQEKKISVRTLAVG